MQTLKKYNALSTLVEHKWLFGGLTLLYPLVYVLWPVAFMYGWAYAVCTFVSVVYFILLVYPNTTRLVNYTKAHQPAIYKKYDMGRRVYVRSFSPADTETMLQTEVSAAFIVCYKFPVQLFTGFIYFFVLNVIATGVHFLCFSIK